MDRDHIIAVVLVVSFVFLFVAFLGVMAVTGFVFAFTSPDNSGSETVDNTPLIEQPGSSTDSSTGSGTLTGSGSSSGIGSGSSGTGSTGTGTIGTTTQPPAPVCGNGKKETGEVCDANSGCSSNQLCNSSCQCETKPVQRTLLTDISVNKLNFWCAPDFDGKKGLAIKYIEFKNNGATFTYDGTMTVTAVTGTTTDSVQSKASFKFTIPSTKTLGFYQKDILRSDAPYIFLGSTPDKTTLTIDLGESQYITYSYTLKGNDFGSVGCL